MAKTKKTTKTKKTIEKEIKPVFILISRRFIQVKPKK